MTDADGREYLESWAKEFGSRADRVRNLIGDVHWPSDGQHKEILVRDFLSRYMPPQLVVCHGFVRSLRGHLCSREIDVLVVDPSADPPLFSEGGLYIVPPSSVVAHVQVKSSFSKDNLSDALENIQTTQSIIHRTADADRVWRGVFFFSIAESRTLESFLDTVKSTIVDRRQLIRDAIAALGALNAADPTALLPQSIATLSSFCAIANKDGSRTKFRAFELAELSMASAFIDLIAHARRWMGGSVDGELDGMLEAAATSTPIHEAIEL